MSEDLIDFLLDRLRADQFRADNLHTVADLLRAQNPEFADLVDDTARQIVTACDTKRVVAQRIRDSLTAGTDPSDKDVNLARVFAAAYRDDPHYHQQWAPHP